VNKYQNICRNEVGWRSGKEEEEGEEGQGKGEDEKEVERIGTRVCCQLCFGLTLVIWIENYRVERGVRGYHSL
jgi:hypothetical protein